MTIDVYLSLFEPFWQTLPAADDVEAFLGAFGRLPAPARHAYAAYSTRDDVTRNGFEPYLSNDGAVLAPEAALAFETLGLPFTANVIERAIGLFPAPYPRGRLARRNRLLMISDNDFEVLDDGFRGLVDGENGGFEQAFAAYAESVAAELASAVIATEPEAPTASVRVVRPSERDTSTAQTPGMFRAEGIGARTVGAQGIWVGHVTVTRGVHSGAHHHGDVESAIYIVSGKARFRYGDSLQHVVEAQAGDFIFVPPYLVHQEINASSDEPVEMIVSRSSQENIVVNVDVPEPAS